MLKNKSLMEEKRVEKFKRLPDKHGASYDAIEKFIPQSYIKLRDYVKSFLDYSDPNKIKNSPPISASMLVAPWGLGKTTTYDVIIKDLLKKDEYNGASIKLRAQDIANYYDTYKEREEFKEIPGNADRFLLIITKLLQKNIELQKKVPEIENIRGSNTDFINNFFNTIKEKKNFFLIFVDELEEVLRDKNNIVPFILKALKDLLNGSSNIIKRNINPELTHFLSFIVACTDAAMYEISRHEQLEYQYGGIKRRIHTERILDISLEESIEFLNKLNTFCYEGKIINSFKNPGASFNTLARMSMKNPGYMKSFFTELMNRAGSRSQNHRMLQIDGRFIINNSKSFNLEYMETNRRAINAEIYNNWFQKFKNNEITKNLLAIFIGEIRPFSVDDLKNRFKKDLKDIKILTNINRINEYIRSIHPNIQNAITEIKLFDINITRADIQNQLNESGFIIEESNNYLEDQIVFPGEKIQLGKFLEKISYYEVDISGKILEKFYFINNVEALKEIFPNLNRSTLKILITQFNKLMKKNNDYFIINPLLFNIIFPLPIPQEYNLLDDSNKTVSLWTEVSRKKKSKIYQKDICKIVSKFLKFNDLIDFKTEEDVEEEDENEELQISEEKNLSDLDYFEEILDENKFILLENIIINELSNNPINILLWRELGDYNRDIINKIIFNIERYRIREKKNIHLLFLLSQSKIQQELVDDLSDNLEYTIVKDLLLSQFDVTKYAFLHEIQKNRKGQYDREKFEMAVKKLLSPLEKIIESCKENMDHIGLTIKLNKYMSKLSNIPQLLKYLIYDFESDFDKYQQIKITKPFEHINPIGLYPGYSSSIDDWSQKRLRSSIEEFLERNGFVNIENNSLRITFPKIEKNIYQIIKKFNEADNPINLKNLSLFFFDKSDNPSLLSDVFISDLKNRGLIQKSNNNLEILQIDKNKLRNKFKTLKKEINELKLENKNLYHIFTFKKRDYSLVLLESFQNTLKNLLKENRYSKKYKYEKETKNRLFLEIYNVFDKILAHVFKPLDLEIEKIEDKIKKKRDSLSESLEEIREKLEEYGLQNLEIKKFESIISVKKDFDQFLGKIRNPISEKDLEKKAEDYYNNNKKKKSKASGDFYYTRLNQNKFEEDFESPFLNLIFNEIEKELEETNSAEIFDIIENSREKIKAIDQNYSKLKDEYLNVDYSEESTVLPKIIYKKVNNLLDLNFFDSTRNLTDFFEIQEYLENLENNIDKVYKPISKILKRRRWGSSDPKSRLDMVHNKERELSILQSEIMNYVEFLDKEKILDKRELKKFKDKVKNSDVRKFKKLIEKCKSLDRLKEVTKDVYNDLKSEIDAQEKNKRNVYDKVNKHFKNNLNIQTLKKIFKNSNSENYINLIKKYSKNLKELTYKTKEINFNEICENLISLKRRIKNGYKTTLKKGLREIDNETKEIFFNMLTYIGEKDWFSHSELDNLKDELNITKERILEVLDKLDNKNLIEKRYFVRSKNL